SPPYKPTIRTGEPCQPETALSPRSITAVESERHNDIRLVLVLEGRALWLHGRGKGGLWVAAQDDVFSLPQALSRFARQGQERKRNPLIVGACVIPARWAAEQESRRSIPFQVS